MSLQHHSLHQPPSGRAARTLAARTHAARAVATLLAGLAAAPLAAGVPVEGWVEGPGGQAVAGAEVLLLPRTTEYEQELQGLAGRPTPEPAARARTDGRGAYSLAAPGPGLWKVRVSASGFAPRQHTLEPLLETTVLPTLELEPATRLVVRVVGEGGRPLAGARVRLGVQRSRPWRGLEWGQAPQLATADAEGKVRLLRPPADARRGGAVTVSAWAPGYLDAEVTEVTGPAVTLPLARGRPVILEARAHTGSPAPGALAVVGDGAWPAAEAGEDGRLTVWAPAEGQLEVTLLAPGARRLKAEVAAPPPARSGHAAGPESRTEERTPAGADAEPTAGAEARLDSGTEAHPGSRTEAPEVGSTEPGAEAREGAGAEEAVTVLVLPPPAELIGRVLAAGSEEPIPGALVWAEGGAGPAAVTDGAGRYSLQVAAEDRQPLKAAARGFLPEQTRVTAGKAEVPPILLEPAVALEGRVVGGDGEPVVAAALTAVPDGDGRFGFAGRYGGVAGWAFTFTSGRFLMPHLTPRQTYRIAVEAEGFAPTSVTHSTGEAGGVEPPLVITLSRGRVGFGYVLGPEEVPVPGAEVALRPMVGPNEWWKVRDAATRPPAVTDGEGRFELANLPGGMFALVVAAGGYAPARVPGIEVPPGEGAVDLGTVLLERGAAIHGRVVDPDGRPLAAAQVRAPGRWTGLRESGGAGAGGEVLTDRAGRFVLPDLRPGERVDLEVRLEGYAGMNVPGVAAPTEEPVVVTLVPTCRIEGRVLDPAGRPLVGVHVLGATSRGLSARTFSRRMRARASRMAESDETGRFVLEEVAPGAVRLRARGEGYLATELEVEVAAGRELTGVELVLTHGASVAGTVRAADGSPVAGVTVRWEGEAPRLGGSSTMTDAEGRYRLEGVAPGLRVLTAQHRELSAVARETEVRPGENHLDLTFPAGVQVGGRVVNAGGEPVAAAAVVLQTMGGFWSRREAASGEDGAFTFEGVTPGRYRLEAAAEGYADAISGEEVDVESAPVFGLEVVLHASAVITGRIRGLDLDGLGALRVMADSQGGRMAPGQVSYEGVYRIPEVGPGTWRVVAVEERSGHMVHEEVSLEPGQAEATLDLDFSSGLTLTGLVLAEGQPVPGVSVLVEGREHRSMGAGTTDHQGRFRVEGLQPGPHELKVLGDFGPRHSQELSLDGDRDVVVELEAVRLTGTVVDAAAGTPLAGVRVELVSVEADGSERRLAAAVTDAVGLFRIGGVAGGRHRLLASREGYGAVHLDLEVVPGVDVEGLRLAMEPSEGLALEVRLANGLSPARVVATLLAADGRGVLGGSYRVDTEGRVRIPSAPPGSWELLLDARGAGVARVAVRVPGEPVRVTLPDAGRLRLRVPQLAAEALVGTLTILGPGGRPYAEPTWGGQVEKQWKLATDRLEKELPVGSWTLRVTTADGRVWEGTAVVQPAVVTELTLD